MRTRSLAAILLLLALLLTGCRYVVVESEPVRVGATAAPQP